MKRKDKNNYINYELLEIVFYKLILTTVFTKHNINDKNIVEFGGQTKAKITYILNTYI